MSQAFGPTGVVKFFDGSFAPLSNPGETNVMSAGGVLYASYNGGAYVTVGISSVHVLPTITGDGSAGNPLAVNNVLARAQSLIPSALFDTVNGTDFDNDATYATSTAGTGAAQISHVDKGGVVLPTSGASPNGVVSVIPHGAASFIDNAKTSPWYLYARFKLASASTDGQDIRAVGCDSISGSSPAAPNFDVGVLGSISTTNFSYNLTNGSSVSIASGTGPALDTNWHTVEITNDATTATIYFDGVSIGTTPATNLPTSAFMWVVVTANGTTATTRSMACDKIWVVCKGN